MPSESILGSLGKTKSDEVHQEVTQKTSEIDELKRQNDDLKASLLAALAENDNMKKRHIRDIEDRSKFAISGFVSELVVAFEHIFKALEIKIADDEQSKSFYSGIEMTRDEFTKIFAKHGLTRIFPIGEKFDHNFHQAISKIKVEGSESGAVVNVVSAGYILHGRIVKPAMVVVCE